MEVIHVDENIQPPNAVAGEPITATDVFHALKYATVNKRRRLHDGAVEVTDAIIADGEKQFLKKVVAYGEGDVAPVWFADAVAAAVGPAVAAAIAPLQASLHNTDARIYNSTLLTLQQEGEYLPLMRGNENLEAVPLRRPTDLPEAGLFPLTYTEASTITAGRIHALEDFYGRHFVGDDMPNRRKAFLRFITRR